MSTDETAGAPPTIVSATPDQALAAVAAAAAGDTTLQDALAHVNAALTGDPENADLVAAKSDLEEKLGIGTPGDTPGDTAPPSVPTPEPPDASVPPTPEADTPTEPVVVQTVAVPNHDAVAGGWPNDWVEYRPTGSVRAKLMQDAFVVADGSAEGGPGDYYVIYLDEHGEPRATSPFAVLSEQAFVAAFDVAN